MPHIFPLRLAHRILDGDGNADSEVLSSPTRLVDMGFIATGRIKIVEPRQHNEQITGRYVTLSHCWYV
jgi:hypothetical protein